MKLFLISDTHGTVPPVPLEYDAALIAGDFSDSGRLYEPLFDALSARSRPIFFVPGEHESSELCEHIHNIYKAVCLDYTWTKWGDIFIAGVGGDDIHGNKDRLSARETFKQRLWSLQINPAPRFSLLLSHEPPSPWKYKQRDRGKKSVNALLKAWRFHLVVSGHFHEDNVRFENNGTPIVNPSFDGCLVDIDLTTRTFQVVTVYPTE